MSIRNISASVRDARSIVFCKNRSYCDKAALTSNNWKGDIGSAYNDFNRSVKSNIYKTLNKYQDLSSKLDMLERSIKRTEATKALKR